MKVLSCIPTKFTLAVLILSILTLTFIGSGQPARSGRDRRSMFSSLTGTPGMASITANSPSIDLAASYTIIGAEPLYLSACTYPEDVQRIIITSRTLNINEASGGNFSGTLTLTGLDSEGSAVGGSFVVSGAAASGNPRSISGTMQSDSPSLSILNGSFSGTWSRTGGLASFRINISGRGTTDGDGFCNYSATLPMVNVQASPTSELLTGTYNAEQNTISVACPDPLDNETLYPRSGTVQFTETSPDNFTGSMSLGVLTKMDVASGSFELSGTSPSGSQSISGTMTGTEIFTGQFSGSANNTATVSVFTMGVSGLGLTDPAFPDEAPCTYTGNIKMTAALADTPKVTTVTRTYPGYFLENSNNFQNVFNIAIDWKGFTPNKVRLQINGMPSFEVDANAAGAIHPFNMTTDFPTRFAPSEVRITPIAANGVEGPQVVRSVYVFPYPSWLSAAILQGGPEFLTFAAGAGEVRANFKKEFPDFHALIKIPEIVPYIGGDLGLRKTTAKVNGYISTLGEGSLTVGGGSGLRAMGQEVAVKVEGTGTAVIGEGGFRVTTASLSLKGEGTIKKSVGLLDAVPGLSKFNNFAVIRRFNQAGRLTGSVKPSINLESLNFTQNPAGELEFAGSTGGIGLELKAAVNSKFSKNISFEGWVAGGGDVVVGVPTPFMRSGSVMFEAGSRFTFNSIFGGTDFEAKIARKCTWTNSADPDTPVTAACITPPAEGEKADVAAGNAALKIRPIRHPYETFGELNEFRANDRKVSRSEAALPQAAAVSEPEITVAANIFPGAEPAMVPVGPSSRMLLWVKQNASLPAAQSTEIAWSYFNGAAWSSPGVIETDTRAEMSPVAGVDPSGKVVAAWLRNRVTAFSEPVATLQDLPLFYKQMEVVSAVFDPASGAWGPVTVLTDDLALDTNLKLSADESGKLLLTWQSNPGGELEPTTANPGSLKFSFWNGSGWNAPQSIADNLSNTSRYSAALKGDNAFVVYSRDADINVSNDQTLIAHSWDGSAWGAASVFAGGDVDNSAPNAVFDPAGNVQVVWRRGADLVRAGIGETTSLVRADSGSLAFDNVRLTTNPVGNLTLIWEEASDLGVANIFASVFNPNTRAWSADFRLNEDQWQSKDAAAFYANNGKLQIAYLATRIDRVDKTVTVAGDTFVVPNVPVNGQTDLRVFEYAVKKPTLFDYDADGRSDLSVRRPSDGIWYILRGTAGYMGIAFGVDGDALVPADYDGDGKTDVAVFRPSNSTWYIFNSASESFAEYTWGIAGDIPVPADHDADGKADLAIFRPSTGTWYTRFSNGTFSEVAFGVAGDKPVAGDFDGDGRADVAVYRPSDGNWHILKTGFGYFAQTWGAAGDIPVPADYDGDGKTDVAVWRPSTGEWHRVLSGSGFHSMTWGVSGDVPVAADYDGDGKSDVAVFRPSDGMWYIVGTAGGQLFQNFGQNGDVPTQSAFIY